MIHLQMLDPDTQEVFWDIRFDADKEINGPLPDNIVEKWAEWAAELKNPIIIIAKDSEPV